MTGPTGATLPADHSGWAGRAGTLGRLMAVDGAVWHTSWDGGMFRHTLLAGAGRPPVTMRVGPEQLPEEAPALLTGSLAAFGAVMLVPTADVWDAITSAVLGRGLEVPLRCRTPLYATAPQPPPPRASFPASPRASTRSGAAGPRTPTSATPSPCTPSPTTPTRPRPCCPHTGQGPP